MFITETQIRIHYALTDQMGVVYYGHYAQFYEIGRTEAIRQIGYTYKEIEALGIIMPVVDIHSRFLRPAKYDDLITVKTTLKEMPAHFKIVFHSEIFNQQDELEATAITDKICMEYPVEIMNIMPDSADQYRELSSQQIPKSKLAVVYFKYAADWALPFIKQIWKEVGGASSPTPLFLIGDDEPKTNLARTFKAPKVVSTVVSKEQIPAEVKKVYTSVIELK